MQDLELPVKPLLAGLDLHRQGIAVARRPALQDVADIDLLPSESDRGQQFIEELPGRAHEGASLLIFVPAWRFTDEGNSRVLRALAGHHFGTLPSEFALAAIGNLPAKFAECRHA
jgi:hypothetical protein